MNAKTERAIWKLRSRGHDCYAKAMHAKRESTRMQWMEKSGRAFSQAHEIEMAERARLEREHAEWIAGARLSPPMPMH